MVSGNPVLIPVPTDVDGPSMCNSVAMGVLQLHVEQWLAIKNGSYEVTNQAPLCYGGKKKAPCCFFTCTKIGNYCAEAAPGGWCCDCSPMTNQLHISQRF